MHGGLGRKRDRRHMRMGLQFEQVSDGAHDQAVHHQSGGEGGEFGSESIHVYLLVQIIDPYRHDTARVMPVAGSREKRHLTGYLPRQGAGRWPRTLSADSAADTPARGGWVIAAISVIRAAQDIIEVARKGRATPFGRSL